jgi:hypothetical protein
MAYNWGPARSVTVGTTLVEVMPQNLSRFALTIYNEGTVNLRVFLGQNDTVGIPVYPSTNLPLQFQPQAPGDAIFMKAASGTCVVTYVEGYG